MKMPMVALLSLSACLLTGCVSPQHELVLDPIGPPSSSSAGAGSSGTLVVYSAFDPHADFNDLPYVRHYTDYQIVSADGSLRHMIYNTNGQSLDAPKRVELPVGTYRVMADANGYGLVTVPVVIRANQTTTVHLEGNASWSNNTALLRSNPVRLPDGEIAGWRASPDNAIKP